MGNSTVNGKNRPMLAVDIGDISTQIAVSGVEGPTGVVTTAVFPSAVRVSDRQVTASGSPASDGIGLSKIGIVVERPRMALGRSTVEVGGRTVAPAELVAPVVGAALERFREEAEEGFPAVTVLTYPAHWSERARLALRDAGLRADVDEESLKMVSAAVAVAAVAESRSDLGDSCLVVCVGGLSSDIALLRCGSGEWSVEQGIAAPGADGPAGIGDIVARVIKVLPATWCRILVAGESADAVTPVLKDALIGRNGMVDVVTVDGPLSAVSRGALVWAGGVSGTFPEAKRRRRTIPLLVVAVVALVAAVAASVVFINRKSQDSLEPYAAGIPSERLAAFIGDDGMLSCSAVYQKVSAKTLVDAHLGLREIGMVSQQSDRGESGGNVCATGYVGDQLGPVKKEVDGLIKSDAVPLMFSVSGQEEYFSTGSDVVNYRDWRLASIEEGEKEARARVRTAMTTVPQRGSLMLSLDLDDLEERESRDRAEYDPDAALKQVIDGLEDSNRFPVGPGTPTLIDDRKQFTCSSLYDSVSAAGLEGRGLILADSGNTVLNDSGDEVPVVVPQVDPQGREQCWLSTPDTPSGVAINMATGMDDGISGYPVVGADDLVGWEEYWAFSPVIKPMSTLLDGVPTYNLRYCQSGKDHCITLSANENMSARNLFSTPAELKNETLPIARALYGSLEQ